MAVGKNIRSACLKIIRLEIDICIIKCPEIGLDLKNAQRVIAEVVLSDQSQHNFCSLQSCGAFIGICNSFYEQ